jgi:hypothetical protein
MTRSDTAPSTGRYVLQCLLLTSGLLVASADSQAGDTMRCGTRLVQKNDLAIQVADRCGRPISKEVIGYTLKRGYLYRTSRPREFKIEQWIYGPERGFYTEVIFEAGRVKAINRIKN